jgi:hypothetical protein
VPITNAVPKAAPDVALDSAATPAVDGRIGVVARVDFDIAERVLAGHVSAGHLGQSNIERQLLVDRHRVAQHTTLGAEISDLRISPIIGTG